MAQKPSIPKGTRDFIPAEMSKRKYIFDTIQSIFILYGYLPIETPAMETMQTLMGKYGEEGDKLIFKILNSGEFNQGISADEYAQVSSTALAHKICEKALRYDLTVPFARFVVMHQNEIQFPFKRYQIQPVWRADRPQKGRYREFYQCDADIVGSNSLVNEVELVQMVDAVFSKLGIRVCIKINNRKILAGIAEVIGESDKIIDITVAIDKLEKVGIENVNKELSDKGIADSTIAKLQPILELHGTTEQKLQQLQTILQSSEVGKQGIAEIEYICTNISHMSLSAEVELDLTLARGLNYYTGAIFEVKSKDVQIGSICGGGRYDNLTGIFGLPGVSGVGISFGADRIYDVLQQLDAYPAQVNQTAKILFVCFGEPEQQQALLYAQSIRSKGIACEVYPDVAKMKKQMQYANDRGIPYVGIIGETELESHIITLKHMQSGEQKSVSIQQCVEVLAAID
ncbi:MAG TPA: histidine--tRNA ligase [Bacteroidales bacterium]|nr:MAG: Histidine--tRNA ligase [Bacteroidetes bacterium ADurb.Bin217]HPH16223.1 histidine--tRNA ligase [Bacteroidales bacterium]HPM12434.1 histidine--tRNA ligase [Bacteroidales bacterium]